MLELTSRVTSPRTQDLIHAPVTGMSISTDTTSRTLMLLRSWRRRSAVLITLGFFATFSSCCGCCCCCCCCCALAGGAGRFVGVGLFRLGAAPPAGLGLSLAAGASARAYWAPWDDFGALRLAPGLGEAGLKDASPPAPDDAEASRFVAAMTSARCAWRVARSSFRSSPSKASKAIPFAKACLTARMSSCITARFVFSIRLAFWLACGRACS